jgi:uncharacterized protein (TIGR00255 family)
MTGYGRGEAFLFDRKFVVEIKSVNHRYSDLSLKMPKILNCFEDRIRKLISKSISRGKIDVFISFQSYSKKDIKIVFNEALADTYVEQINIIADRYNCEKGPLLEYLLDFDGILTIDNTSFDESRLDEIWEALNAALDMAVLQSLEMREAEGGALKEDILSKSNLIHSLVTQIKERYPDVILEYRERLGQKIKEVLDNPVFDENRILTEVTIFSDKICVDEEATRLFSHVSQLSEILQNGGIIGRKLDFLIQELNREVNTIGSKSNDIFITKIVIDLKSEIEKIREQAQNIE